MNQEYSAREIFIWNLTMHDPYSNESLARRFLASGVGSHDVAKILDLDFHYVYNLDNQDAKLFLDFSKKFSKVMKNIKTRDKAMQSEKIKYNLFSRFDLSNSIGLARVLGMSTAQFQIFNEQFLSDWD